MRAILFGLLSALTIGSCNVQEKNAPAANTTETLIVINDRLFVPAKINGVGVEALLDSGAEMTVLDTSFAWRIGLSEEGEAIAHGTGGETRAAFAQNVRIEAAGVTLEDRLVAIIDLGDVSERLVGKPVAAIIGRDLFDAARFEIDIERGAIRAVSRGEQPSGVRLALQEQHGLETIPVSVEGGEPVRAVFDLGNGSEVLIGAAYAASTGLSGPERIVANRTGGGLGGEVTRKIVRLGALEIAGVVFRDVEAGIDETEKAHDVNVGVRILRRLLLTVDFEEGAIWFAAEGR